MAGNEVGLGHLHFLLDGSSATLSQPATAATTYTYDAVNRLSGSTDPRSFAVSYNRDENGNITKITYPGNKTVSYAYDGLNRLTNVTDWAGRQTTFEYDLASRLKTITRPNGTQRILNYDAAGQTTNIIEQTSGGNIIAFFKLNWNAAARVEHEFAAPLPQAYTAPTRTMTFDEDNRIETFNGQTVIHDSDGNMTWGPLTNSAFSIHTYDARNRLLSAGGLSYGYDALGNRTALTNGASVTKFVINPNAALSQVLMRVKGGVTNYYVYGLGLLYEADDFGSSRTYHYDYRGSAVALTDGSGNVTESHMAWHTPRGELAQAYPRPTGRLGLMEEIRAVEHLPDMNPDPVGLPDMALMLSDVIVAFEKAEVVHLGDLVYNRFHPHIDVARGGSVTGWVKVLAQLITAYGTRTLFICSHAKEGYPVVIERPELEQQRQRFGKRVESEGGKLTVTAVLLKIAASAIRAFPQFNSSIDVERSSTSSSRSFGMTMTVSHTSRSSTTPFSAAERRRDPSKRNGSVTIPTVSAPTSFAIRATTGAAPVPVPPPSPAVTKTMSDPRRTCLIWSYPSSAAWRPS